MSYQVYPKKTQAQGAFNGGQIIENKPLGFPSDGGTLRPYSNLFYWANAIAVQDSTIGLHPHRGFEILSFVLDGEIRHYDTKLNKWIDLKAGDVQVIRSGSGISHSEHMTKDSRMFQIWLDPNLEKTMAQDASYDDYESSDFKTISQDGIEKLKFVGDDAPIQLDTTGLNIERWQVNDKIELLYPDAYCSVYVLSGNITIDQTSVTVDDFIHIEPNTAIALDGNAELFVIINKQKLPYQTYTEMMVKSKS